MHADSDPPSRSAARSDDQRLTAIVEKNINSLLESRRRFQQSRSREDRAADRITCFSGSMLFVYLHAAWFAGWIIVNVGWTPVAPFDAFPFGLLTMVVSLEAIFLSTFVLVSQNRMQVVADRRADLDLQINLLAEHEVTRLLVGVHAIADKLGVDLERIGIASLEEDVSPNAVLDAIEQCEDGALPAPEETDAERPVFTGQSA